MSKLNKKIERTIFLNTSSNLFKFFVSIIITFVMTPVILRSLGNHDYGIWEIIISVTGYLGLLDIGLRPTISRFAARVSPVNNPNEWRIIYSTSFFLMLAVGFVVGSVFLIWSFVSPQSLVDNPEQLSRYVLFLQLVAVQVFTAFIYYHLESILEGGQRYVLKNNVALLDSIVSATIVYNFIDAFDPLIFLCTLNIVTTLIKVFVFTALLSPKGYSKFPSVFLFDKNLVKSFYGFGFKSFLQNASTSIERRTDVIIVGSFLGPSTVVFYSIPQALLTRIRGFISTFTQALMPAFSQLDASGHGDLIRQIFLTNSRLVVAIISFFSVCAFTLGTPFVGLWVGIEYIVQAESIIYLLTAYLFIGSLVPLGNRYMTAVGRHGVLAKMYTIRAFINLASSLLLVKPLGLQGVALGSLIGAVAVFPFESRAILRCVNVGTLQYLRTTLLPVVFPAISMGGCAIVGRYCGWTDDWWGFFITGLISTVVYFLVYLFFGASPEDRSRILNLRKNIFHNI